VNCQKRAKRHCCFQCELRVGWADELIADRFMARASCITQWTQLLGAKRWAVTQAFNTTNSMGRLTLNVLLSFAQALAALELDGVRLEDV